MKTENLNRIAKNSKKSCAAASAFCLIFAFAAILLLFGVVICAVLSETALTSPGKRTLLYILAGSFGGGAALFALAAYGMGRLSRLFDLRARDARERADSPESFYVGEGVLATFAEDALEFHAEGREGRIRVPYPELTFYSVCSRTAPREKGIWKAVIGVPANYLRKNAEGEGGPVLIETDYKPRFACALKRRGIEFVGEPYQKTAHGVRFSRMKTFKMPLDARRKRAIVFAALGAAVAGAGIAVAFLLSPFIGAVVTVFGGAFAVRSLWRAVFSGRSLAVYREGIYWREDKREERIFLKWEEIVRLSAEERETGTGLRAVCACGAYVFPLPRGAYEYLAENFPEKFGG